MIYRTIQQLTLFYGAAGVSFSRFNADHSTLHTTPGYKFEFGYIQGRCIYAIIQKADGGSLSLVEAASMMAVNGPGAWKLITGLDPQKDGAAIQKMLDNRAVNLGYTYASVSQDAFYPSALLCSHQLNREQVVIYHPIWQADLGQVSANPIT